MILIYYFICSGILQILLEILLKSIYRLTLNYYTLAIFLYFQKRGCSIQLNLNPVLSFWVQSVPMPLAFLISPTNYLFPSLCNVTNTGGFRLLFVEFPSPKFHLSLTSSYYFQLILLIRILFRW